MHKKTMAPKSDGHGNHKMGQKKSALFPHEMPDKEAAWAEKQKSAMNKGMPKKKKMKRVAKRTE